MIASSGTREGESSSGVTRFEDDFDGKCVRVSNWAQCWSPQAQMLDVGKRSRSCAAEQFLHRSLEEGQEHMADGLRLCLVAPRSLPQKCMLGMSFSSQVQLVS